MTFCLTFLEKKSLIYDEIVILVQFDGENRIIESM